MIRDQFSLLTTDEIIVDNFAGGGGASTGLELGLGRHVDIAINHDPEAIALHAANHPQTEHYIEGVFAIDPRTAAQGFPTGYHTAINYRGKRLAKSAQVRMCGNSVSPVIPAALARANLPELCAWNHNEAKTRGGCGVSKSTRRGSKHGTDRPNTILYCKRGSDLPQSKLTPDLVREIRASYLPGDKENGQHGLARRYNVHQRTIEKIVTYAIWRHVA